MKTIAKNRKIVTEIFRNATEGKAYTLENYFNGQDCDPKWAEKALHQFSFAKLYEDEPGKYRVRVHSNCWYVFKSEH